MTREKADALVELLDDEATFAEFADRYMDALESGGGLENVLEDLRAEAAS